MKVELMEIERVIPYARNPRDNAAAVDGVAASIREFGFRQPVVVDEQRTIIVGHTRFYAARKLGLTKIPVHVAENLSEAQIKAYRLADNKTGEKASWDEDLLKLELLELEEGQFDLDLTGFESGDLDRLLQAQVGEDEEDFEAIERESEEATSGADLLYLAWGNRKVPMSEEEAEMLSDRLEAYAEESGMTFGFVSALLEGEASVC